MTTRNTVYLVSILVLTLPILWDEWLIGKRKLRRYWRILAVLALCGLIYGTTESFALRWIIWTFSRGSDLEVYVLGAHLETYVVNALVFPAIGAATLLLIGADHKIKKRRATR